VAAVAEQVTFEKKINSRTAGNAENVEKSRMKVSVVFFCESMRFSAPFAVKLLGSNL
jgi:hypothetical protein